MHACISILLHSFILYCAYVDCLLLCFVQIVRRIKTWVVIVVIVLVALDKASDTHIPYIFTYALEFYLNSSMHDRCCFSFQSSIFCLEYLVVCSHPLKPYQVKVQNCQDQQQLLASHMLCWWFTNFEKLNNPNAPLGGLVWNGG